MMKHLFLFILIFAKTTTSFAVADSITLSRIKDQIMLKGQCYEDLRVLCKQVGHRLSGSPEAAKAVQWGVEALKKAGADTVWLQPVKVPKWVRGKESLSINTGNGFKEVKMLSLGNAYGTNGKTLEAPIIMVNSFAEYKNLQPENVKGKIVFFNYKFRQDLVSTFHGYGDAVKYRGLSPTAVAQKGGVGVIIRSVSTGLDDEPHTGMTRYVDSLPKIPAIAIGNTSADALEKAYSVTDKLMIARITTNCKMVDTAVISYNVIGEIKGSQNPDQYIVCGGHLDSWDVGEGAHDDGAGCVQAIEVIRTMKALNFRPKRTIRAVLFMNEENGAKGGRAYADSAVAHKEKHIFAMESDAGGFSPRGVGLEMSEDKKAAIRKYADAFKQIGVYDLEQEEGGVDIGPLAKTGTPLAGLLPDPQRYFDIHHTAADVFEAVNHRELKLGAVAMAYLIYIVSENGL